MNQILITQKLYVTPELKRKKKLYKINFFLAVFSVCVLFSYYIYAEYDRNRNEEVSKQILSRIDLGGEANEVIEEKKDTSVRIEDNVLIVTLNEEASNRAEIDITKLAKEAQQHIENHEQEKEVYTAESGEQYSTDSILNIPSLGINYPVLDKTSEELLKISLTKFYGCNPNEVGNYVIVGHNYRNKKMFGKLPDIKIGDTVELTDLTGRKLTYAVYDKYIVDPEDVSCIEQNTDGKKEITLITCKSYGTQRQIVKAREVK